jgi:hypothetical protein
VRIEEMTICWYSLGPDAKFHSAAFMHSSSKLVDPNVIAYTFPALKENTAKYANAAHRTRVQCGGATRVEYSTFGGVEQHDVYHSCVHVVVY